MAPLLLGGMAAALLPVIAPAAASDPSRLALLTLGFLGAILVHEADRRSPLDAWQRAFPELPMRRVKRLPTRPSGAGRLAGALSILEEARSDGASMPREGRQERRRRRTLLREIDDTVAGLAHLLDRIEQIEDLDRPGEALLTRRTELLHRVARLEKAALVLRDTLRRVEPTLTTVPAPPVAALIHLERDLSARLDCAAELEALELSP